GRAPLGPHRHRRHRLGYRTRVLGQGTDRVRRPSSGRARPRSGRLIRATGGTGRAPSVPSRAEAARSGGHFVFGLIFSALVITWKMSVWFFRPIRFAPLGPVARTGTVMPACSWDESPLAVA